MMIARDFLKTLKKISTLEVALLSGPRQVGKTTLLDQLPLKGRVFLDDLTNRRRANDDPAFFLDQLPVPCLIDEVQYAPQLFPELKLRIDHQRRQAVKAKRSKRQTWYYLTGSNRILLDKNVKESLAGRCSLFFLHGLSVKELVGHFGKISLQRIMFLGGFPDLYTQADLPPISYLNDYLISFIEKDIAFSAGIQKLGEFHTVLRLLAARTGQFLNVNEIAQASGVEQKTVQSWISILQRSLIVELVQPFFSNLSKRIVKMPKLFFYDTGICGRLQNQANEETLWNSAQTGSLFETLVFSEIVKTRDNFQLDCQLFTWRTKERKEIDFIIQAGKRRFFLEAKMAIHGARPYALDSEAQKVFPRPHEKLVVSAGGKTHRLDRETLAVPVQELGDFLVDALAS